mgnify:CR=1 FL=1
MKFAYEDLSDDQFEVLIVLLCQRLLGIAVQGFAKGPDGGRDAKFVGTAELHPSKTAPWVGTVIVQAKHTNGYNRSFSELDFYSTSSSNTVVGKEVPRIKKLREAKQLDHYMLFANRRLTGNSETEIRDHIAAECGVPASSIYLCGLEQLELWLKRFPEVAQEANLDAVDSPLIVSPDDLAEVVQALARQKDGLTALLDDPPTVRVTYEEKNTLNNMLIGTPVPKTNDRGTEEYYVSRIITIHWIFRICVEHVIDTKTIMHLPCIIHHSRPSGCDTSVAKQVETKK